MLAAEDTVTKLMTVPALVELTFLVQEAVFGNAKGIQRAII